MCILYKYIQHIFGSNALRLRRDKVLLGTPQEWPEVWGTEVCWSEGTGGEGTVVCWGGGEGSPKCCSIDQARLLKSHCLKQSVSVVHEQLISSANHSLYISRIISITRPFRLRSMAVTLLP